MLFMVMIHIDNDKYGNDDFYSIQQDVDDNDDINVNNDDANDYNTI